MPAEDLDFANRIHLVMKRMRLICEFNGCKLQRIVSETLPHDSYRVILTCGNRSFFAHVSRLDVLDAHSLDALAETMVHQSQILRVNSEG